MHGSSQTGGAANAGRAGRRMRRVATFKFAAPYVVLVHGSGLPNAGKLPANINSLGLVAARSASDAGPSRLPDRT